MDFKLLFEDLKQIVESKSEAELKEHLETFFASKEAEIATVFESAVEEKVKEIKSALEEEAKVKEEAKIAEAETNMESTINVIAETLEKYMDASFDKVMEQHVNDFSDEIRLSVVESAYESLKKTMIANGFEVDPAQKQVVEEYKTALSESEDKINQLTDMALNLTDDLKDARFTLMFNETVAKVDLSDVDREKFASMCESLEFNTDEEALSMMNKIIENNFSETSEENVSESEKPDEEQTNLTESTKTNSVFDY